MRCDAMRCDAMQCAIDGRSKRVVVLKMCGAKSDDIGWMRRDNMRNSTSKLTDQVVSLAVQYNLRESG